VSSSDVAAVTTAPTLPKEKPRRKRKSPRGSALNFWIFVGPFLIGLLIFSYVPIIWSGVLSFFNAQGTVTPTDFVGVRNYTDLFNNGAFTSSLVTFTIFAAFIIPLTSPYPWVSRCWSIGRRSCRRSSDRSSSFRLPVPM